MSSVPDAKPVPVTLLTGFLGAGKTTFLNELLTDSRLKDSAVIVNEFGSIGVDHDLVQTGAEGFMVTSSGCLCCTAGSDIRTSLFQLSEMVEKGAAPAFARVIVETTGLADPAPIINSLLPGGAPAFGLRDHAVARRFRLASVVTMLDTVNGDDTLDRHIECWKQLAFANDVILTKTDLCADAAEIYASWSDRLRQINPVARLHDRGGPGFEAHGVIGVGIYSPTDKPDDVLGWLGMERLAWDDHADHSHDPNRHGSDIVALPLVQGQPFHPRNAQLLAEILTNNSGPGLLRIKGLLALSDDPTRPLAVHAVAQMLYPSVRLERWPSADTRSRLMVIGRDLPVEPIRRFFDALAPKKAKTSRRRAKA